MALSEMLVDKLRRLTNNAAPNSDIYAAPQDKLFGPADYLELLDFSRGLITIRNQRFYAAVDYD